MKFLRHVGVLKATGHRALVVFRQIPNEPTNCLVVDTDALPDKYHDDLMDAVETITAQESLDFYEYANRQFFSDGTNMLTKMHQAGWLMKVKTDAVVMRPRPDIEISLLELNNQISKLNGEEPNTTEGVLDNGKLAEDLRRQASMFEQQAESLRKQADDLDPPKTKKASKKSNVVA